MGYLIEKDSFICIRVGIKDDFDSGIVAAVFRSPSFNISSLSKVIRSFKINKRWYAHCFICKNTKHDSSLSFVPATASRFYLNCGTTLISVGLAV